MGLVGTRGEHGELCIALEQAVIAFVVLQSMKDSAVLFIVGGCFVAAERGLEGCRAWYLIWREAAQLSERECSWIKPLRKAIKSDSAFTVPTQHSCAIMPNMA